MNRSKRGFTIVEVAIFLAISGLLFLGITAGVQTSVYQQRRNDSIQDFIEFLRGVYSEVENPQNHTKEGRSNTAIYGRLVTFGESRDLAKAQVAENNEIFVYTVVGRVVGDVSSSDGALGALGALGANVFNASEEYAGFVESYTPKWGARIEETCAGSTCSYNPLKAAILIVRHPNSGVISTYYRGGAMEVNANKPSNPLEDLNTRGFTNINNIDLCVNPTGARGEKMADVRIMANARNASSIELVPEDKSVCGN